MAVADMECVKEAVGSGRRVDDESDGGWLINALINAEDEEEYSL